MTEVTRVRRAVCVAFLVSAIFGWLYPARCSSHMRVLAGKVASSVGERTGSSHGDRPSRRFSLSAGANATSYTELEMLCVMMGSVRLRASATLLHGSVDSGVVADSLRRRAVSRRSAMADGSISLSDVRMSSRGTVSGEGRSPGIF